VRAAAVRYYVGGPRQISARLSPTMLVKTQALIEAEMGLLVSIAERTGGFEAR
jgi:hypothetical protein